MSEEELFFLKPGNVLVTEVDGRPTPKVIDFGVAQATERIPRKIERNGSLHSVGASAIIAIFIGTLPK